MLASGEGTTLQALLDASAHPSYGASVVAVGSDRVGARALDRARASAVTAFSVGHGDLTRTEWDHALTRAVSEHQPDLVVCAGFMRILGPAFLDRLVGRTINTHPSLLPAFPGRQAVVDALAYGVKVTGVTVHFVDAGVDTGPVIAQAAVPVLAGDTPDSLHERIKVVEQPLLVDTVGRLARGTWTVEERTVLLS